MNDVMLILHYHLTDQVFEGTTSLASVVCSHYLVRFSIPVLAHVAIEQTTRIDNCHTVLLYKAATSFILSHFGIMRRRLLRRNEVVAKISC